MAILDPEQRAAQALARADPLAALNALAACEGPRSRALRGIALAQIQELDAAGRELSAAAAAFADDPLHRARALAALAEIAAARREIGTAVEALADAADALEAAGDRRNAAWTRLVRVRVLLLTGAVEEARRDLERAADAEHGDPVVATAYELARASSSLRVLSAEEALRTLDGALSELSRDEHPLLAAELDAHREALTRPLARLTSAGTRVEITLPELAGLFHGAGPLPAALDARGGAWLVVDAIARRVLFRGEDPRALGKRDVLFRLLEELALSWPRPLTTGALVERVFDGPAAAETPAARDDLEQSFRDRLRVEVSRLRELLPPRAGIEALGNAWRLAVPADARVAHVALTSADSALTALLADGSPWAARDLALALGVGQRSVQRALKDLSARGVATPEGEARARRWRSASGAEGIASQMLLVSLLAPRR